MSKIESKQEGMQEFQKKSEITHQAKPELENHHTQLFFKESELNITETTVEQNFQLSVQPLERETEGLAQPLTDSMYQELQEAHITNTSPQDCMQAQPELIITTTDDPTSQRIETLPSSQKSPLTLETVYRELMLLREDMQKHQISLQISIESLREEMTLKKQQTAITNLPEGQTDRKRKPTQMTNSHRKTPENKQPRTNKLDFNAVTYLHEHGKVVLQGELEKKANGELIQIGRSVGIKRGKDSKSIEREEMIKKILLNAERRLSAGSVFLKDNKDANETVETK